MLRVGKICFCFSKFSSAHPDYIYLIKNTVILLILHTFKVTVFYVKI